MSDNKLAGSLAVLRNHCSPETASVCSNVTVVSNTYKGDGKIRFSHIKFVNCIFKKCVFEGLVFKGCLFKDCSFERTVFVNCNFDKATFKDYTIDRTVFLKSSLFKARFENLPKAHPLEISKKHSKLNRCNITDAEGITRIFDTYMCVALPVVVVSPEIDKVLFNDKLYKSILAPKDTPEKEQATSIFRTSTAHTASKETGQPEKKSYQHSSAYSSGTYHYTPRSKKAHLFFGGKISITTN